MDDCCTFANDFSFHAERGAAEAKEATAIKMLQDGMSTNLVAQYTNLDIQVVEELEMNIGL